MALFCLTDSGLMYLGSEAKSSPNWRGANGGGGSVGESFRDGLLLLLK